MSEMDNALMMLVGVVVFPVVYGALLFGCPKVLDWWTKRKGF
jgi:hypothetical protein